MARRWTAQPARSARGDPGQHRDDEVVGPREELLFRPIVERAHGAERGEAMHRGPERRFRAGAARRRKDAGRDSVIEERGEDLVRRRARLDIAPRVLNAERDLEPVRRRARPANVRPREHLEAEEGALGPRELPAKQLCEPVDRADGERIQERAPVLEMMIRGAGGDTHRLRDLTQAEPRQTVLEEQLVGLLEQGIREVPVMIGARGHPWRLADPNSAHIPVARNGQRIYLNGVQIGGRRLDDAAVLAEVLTLLESLGREVLAAPPPPRFTTMRELATVFDGSTDPSRSGSLIACGRSAPVLPWRRSSAPARSRRGARVWTVDALDGAVQYLHDLPAWCLSVTLLRDGAPVLAVLHAPTRGETYAARAGAGATRNGRPVAPAAKREIAAAYAATSQPPFVERSPEDVALAGALLSAMLGVVGAVRNLGATSSADRRRRRRSARPFLAVRRGRRQHRGRRSHTRGGAPA